MDYPIWDTDLSRGVLIGIVAISHVIVSHFAIGGGLLIAVAETLAWRRKDRDLRELAKRSSLVLILLSSVYGAISGVGIWIVIGLAAPAAISSLIHTYVWAWAIEWVFFFVEIAAALIYFATWDRISTRAHLVLGWIYFIAAYFSLVVINGIVTFMLTPGRWIETGAFWDGFLNPTYWPALVLRTGIVILMAVAFMGFAALRAAPTARARLTRFLGWWLVAGALLSYAGYRWWEAALPEGVRSLFLGAAPALSALADTRHLVLWSLAATLFIGSIAMILLPRWSRHWTAALVAVVAFTFFGSYERLREGARKPFVIHDYMFSNGVRVAELEELNEKGILSKARWAAQPPAETQTELGRQVYRASCSSCHTMDGYLALRPLVPDDSDMTLGVIWAMQEMGEAYTALETGQRVDKAALDYPFMPPFAGTEEEMEALAIYLAGEAAQLTATGDGS